MGGECYALSSDLVQYVAASEEVLGHLNGAEDKQVAKWMRLHPKSASINWVTERCWVYDHPKAGTTYAHGFLFPDEVERVRAEGRRGLSEEEIEARGGPLAPAYSTVSAWKKVLKVPATSLTMEEEVESLVEGGGRFSEDFQRRVAEEDLVPWSDVVFEVGDERLRKSVSAESVSRSRIAKPIEGSFSASVDHYAGTPIRWGRPPSDLVADLAIEDLPESTLKETLKGKPRLGKRDVEVSPTVESASASSTSSASSAQAQATPLTDPDISSGASQVDDSPSTLPSPGKHAIVDLPDVSPPRKHANPYLIAPPSLRYDPETLALRQRRFLGLPYGGTVVVHYLKRREWFLETALVLLGRHRTWDSGQPAAAFDSSVLSSSRLSAGFETLDGPSSVRIELTDKPHLADGETLVEVDGSLFGGARAYGSPLLTADGDIVEGRPAPQPVPVEEEASAGWWRGAPKLQVGDPEDGPRVPGFASQAEEEEAPAPSSSLLVQKSDEKPVRDPVEPQGTEVTPTLSASSLATSSTPSPSNTQ